MAGTLGGELSQPSFPRKWKQSPYQPSLFGVSSASLSPTVQRPLNIYQDTSNHAGVLIQIAVQMQEAAVGQKGM